MSKRLAEPTVSRHFQFFASDLAFLKKHWGEGSPRGMAMNEIVRTLVHDAVKKARVRLADLADEAPPPQAAEPEATEPLDF
jgi:hypothetical protein